MARVMWRMAVLGMAGAVMGGCAVRLGGPKPETYETVALEASAGASAADVAAVVKRAGGDILLLVADRDSAWFADVATQTGIPVDGPGYTGGPGMAFFTRLEVLGDTTLTVPIDAGGRLHIHDALFEVSEGRNLDLMIVSFAEATSARDGVRTLLKYIATDVGGTSSVLIGLTAPSQAVADSVSTLMRAAFRNALDCGDTSLPTPAGGLGMNLFYGPEARISCESARVLPGSPNGIVARAVVGR
ncbi:MAG TPA: hypothetical protein VF035_02970 [Longimicrobiales bacterium]